MFQARCIRQIVFSLCLGLTSTAHGAATFTNPNRLPTDGDPAIVLSGDLNGDGVPDFVWASDTTPAKGSFGVYLSQPSGGWLPGTSFAATANSGIVNCALVDVNRDSRLDLVCAGSFQIIGYLLVYLGNGDGTFQAPIATVAVDNAGVYSELALANEGDLNGDGIPDFYVIDARSYTANIFLSDGKGGFQAPIGAPKGTNSALPFAADVNGDGIPDLLFPQGPEVALGNGGGSFGLVVSYEQDSYFAASCIFHDMDGDGHLDAVCGYPETHTGDITGATDLIILHGNADGSFNTTPISKTIFGDHQSEFDGFGTFQTPLYVSDVNGDGILDVVAYSGDGLAVLKGGSGLTFSWPLHYAVGYLAPSVIGGASSQGFRDLNVDGIADFLASGPNGIYISYGKLDGSFAAPFAPEVAEVIGYPTLGDFNRDGIPDIAATGDPAIKLNEGKGDGTFNTPIALGNNNGTVNFSTPLSATNAHIAHGDFNGDGKLDLIAIGSPGIYDYQNYILWGNADGTFQQPVPVQNSSNIFPMYEPLIDDAVYDVNHDGRSDLISDSGSTTTQSQITCDLSNGDSSFTPVISNVPSDYSASGYANITLPSLADFNGDGKLDAAYGALNHVYVVNGHGDGSFDSTGAGLPIPTINGLNSFGALSIVTADFDGDSNKDIAVLANYAPGPFPYVYYSTAVWVYYGDGRGNFTAPALVSQLLRQYTNIAAADLDRTGRADLIVRTSGSLGGGYAVGILNSLPGRVFGSEVSYFAGTGLSSLAIVDVNGDGRLDLVFGNGDYNLRASSVTVLLNLGDTPEVTGALKAVPEPSVAGQSFDLVATLSPPTPIALAGSISFTLDGNNVGSAPLSNNSATLPVALALSVGTHSIGAIWPGDSTYPGVTLSATHAIVAIPTTTTIVSSNNPANAGSNIVFTSTTTSTSGTPTGAITFSDGNTVLATVNLNAGVAQYGTSTLAVGTHVITASFAANGNFAASSASVSQVVNGLSSTVTLAATPNPAYVMQSVVLTGNVSAASGTPTGTLAFYDGTTLLGSAALNAGGVATLATSFKAAGTHNLRASYSGDATYSSQVSGVFVEDVILNQSAVTVTATPNPAVAFTSIAFSATVSSITGSGPTGTVAFLANGNPIGSVGMQNGRATFSSSALGPGIYSITAAYAGDSAFASSTSAPVTLTVVQIPTQTTLTSSLNPAPFGAGVTFTATTTDASIAPSGTVQFFDGSTPLGSAVTLDSQGVATYTTSSLALGTHPITAIFAGNTNFLSSTSPVLQQSIVSYVGDFAVSVHPGSASIYTGESTTLHVVVTSLGGFNQPVTLSCAGLPSQTSCALSSNTLSGGQGTVELVIQTQAPQRNTASIGRPSPSSPGGPEKFSLADPSILIAVLVFVFVPGRSRRRVLWMFLFALGAALVSGGCGGPAPISGGTPPGTYNIAISGAYPANNPAVQHSATFTLTVKSLF